MTYRRERLTTISRPHGPGLVLARRHPGDEHLRALAVEHWHPVSQSPRRDVQPGINIPLTTREQTVQQATLPREVQDALNGYIREDVSSRRVLEHERPLLADSAAALIETTPQARRQHGASRIRTRLE
jgi:hypothetical protein